MEMLRNRDPTFITFNEVRFCNIRKYTQEKRLLNLFLFLIIVACLSEPVVLAKNFVEGLIDWNKNVYIAIKSQKEIELEQERGRINLLKLERIGEVSLSSIPE
jgi:hypothetical protein